MTDVSVTGSCLCGAVRYQRRGPFTRLSHCHCSICRKHHGAPFASYVASPLAGFRYLAGEDHLGHFEASPGCDRPFCLTCGSVQPTKVPGEEEVVGPAGNLDGDLGVVPLMHIFVGSRAPWYEITDDLPQHAAFPLNDHQTPVLRRAPPPPAPGCTSGSCVCGQVSFEYEGAPLRMLNCHCSRCRKARSAAHTTNIFVPLDKLRFTRGEALVRDFHLPGARYFGVAFCMSCGGALPRKSPERQLAVVPAGSLDSDPGVRPSAHVYVGSKAPWFEITDDLPQFQEMLA